MSISRVSVLRATLAAMFICLLAGIVYAQDPYPHAPRYFYRIGMLDWSKLKNISGDGKRMFNLFLIEEEAFGFYRTEYSGADNKIYRFTKEDLAKSADGRAFLEEVEQEMSRNPERVDMTVMFSDESAFRETISNIAADRVFYHVPSESRPAGGASVPAGAANEPPAPKDEPIEREVLPAAVDPDLETKVETFLKSIDLQKLEADLKAGNFDTFKNPLFAPESPDAHDKVARAWKKACSKFEFSKHSQLLAEMRWKMLVDIFAEISRDRGIPIELIDSGKRNAYRSDVDLTVYSPKDRRGSVTIKALIDEANARFAELTEGRGTAAFDITIHNGDVFMPDIRNTAQSVADYSKELRDVVKELRLKVESGGDASYIPGSNLEDVQKRGLRDGVITSLEPEAEVVRKAADGTPLETRFKKPEPKESRASEFDSRGGLVSNSSRFDGVTPAYDRSNAFGVLAQNLEKIYRNGNDHGAVAKLFNRGMELGAGAGEVNSYMNIHVSDLPAGDNIPPEEAARIALLLEDPKTSPAEISQLKNRARTKSVAKMRWIARSFGYRAGRTDPKTLTWLYELLNSSADIEQEKAKGNFDWKQSRTRHLERYFKRLAEANAEMAKTPDGIEKLYDNAWREFCDEIVEATENALVAKMKETMRGLSPQEIKTITLRRTDSGGKVISQKEAETQGGKRVGSDEQADAQKQAAKLAERIRTELVLLFDLIESHRKKAANGASEDRDRSERLQALRDRILEDAPPALKAEIEKLDQIAREEMNNFLNGLDEATRARLTPEQLTAAKEQAVRRVAEVGPDQADGEVKEESFRDHVKNMLLWIHNPEDGPLMQQMLDGLANAFRRSTTNESYIDPKTGTLKQSKAGGAFVEQVWQNMTGLMMGSAAVSLTRAYVTGGERGLKEAAVGEAFNFLPPAYGIIGVAFKDFSRGHVWEGTKSLGWLGAIHIGEYFVPGVGHALLVYNIATGIPQIVYTYTTERINSDMVEQALRSKRLQGKRAERNPFKDSADLFKGDTPEFPIFWDSPCMTQSVEDENTPLPELIRKSRLLFSSAIWKELVAKGLSPDSPQWKQEWETRIKKYAFDLPYYQRMEGIYECFHPQVKALMDRGVAQNEENVLKHVFGQEVQKWFSSQPVGYQMSFDDYFDFGSGATRKRLLDNITAQLMREYTTKEYETIRRQQHLEEIDRAGSEQERRRRVAEKQLIATKKRVGDRLQNNLQSYIQSALGNSGQEEAARVQVKAPIWYVNMTGVIKPPAFQANKGGTISATLASDGSSQAPGEKKDGGAGQDGGDIPIDVIVRADRSKYPDENSLKHDFKLALAGPIRKGKPAGFIPNAEEARLLAEVGTDGKPKNEVFTINMDASATVYDNQGKSIGKSKTVPVVGYVIGEVPRFSGQIAVHVHAPLTNSRGTAEEASITYEAQIEKEVKRGQTSNDPRTSNDAKFDNLKAGTYQVTVTSLSPEFGPGSATFTLSDLYTKAVYETNNAPANPDTVEVTLPYKGVTAANNPNQGTGKQPGQDPTKTNGQKLPGNPPGGNKPGGAVGSGGGTQKTIQQCQQLASQAQQFLTAGDMSSAANALQQAKLKGCSGLDPSVDTAIAGVQGAIDDAVKQKAGETQLKSAQCEFEAALSEAQELIRTSPGNPALAGINLAQLQLFAEAQRQARALQREGEQALALNDFNGAVAALQSALALPNLPECMRKPIATSLGVATAGKTFAGLAPQVDAALDRCNSKEAVRIVGQITNIRPRLEQVQTWLNEYAPKIVEMQNREREAAATLEKARAQAKNIRSEFDRQRVGILIAVARSKVAPCELKLDPDLAPFGNPDADPPTDDVPGALDPGKPKEPPTDDVPGALDPGKPRTQPTDDVPGALDPNKAPPPPTGGSNDQPKPKDPNQPGKLGKLIGAIGTVATGIQKGTTNKTGGSGGSESGGTASQPPTSSPQGLRACTSAERDAFSKMTGSFKSYRMNVTIGGSCEQATGSYKVTEWCEGVDATYNPTTARITGTFTGRMEGSSLTVKYQSPPSPHNSAGAKGSGSCSQNGDGTFSCSFGCSDNKYKK